MNFRAEQAKIALDKAQTVLGEILRATMKTGRTIEDAMDALQHREVVNTFAAIAMDYCDEISDLLDDLERGESA